MSDSNKKVIPIPDSVWQRPAGYWDAIVALDADEVLVRYLDGLEGHIRSVWATNGIQRTVNLKESPAYYLHANPKVTGINRDEAGFFARDFALKTKGGFGCLEFYHGAVEAVHKLRGAGIRPMVFTDVPDGMQTSGDNFQAYGWSTARSQREAQFLQHGVIASPDDIVFCEWHRKPTEMTERIYRIPVLVDDKPSTLVLARERGLIPVGIRTAETLYNQGEYEGIVWFDSLAEAYEAIVDVYKRLGDRVRSSVKP